MPLENLWNWLRFEVVPNCFDTFSRRGGVWRRPYFEGRAFYVQPVPFAVVQCVSGVVPFLLFFLHGPAHLQTLVLQLFALKITLGTFVAALVVSRCFPIILNERGIRARNLLGEARRLEWAQIRAVKETRWLGFAPMLLISSATRTNVIWLPLYLDRRAEFERDIREVVPRGNPLREHFETENES